MLLRKRWPRHQSQCKLEKGPGPGTDLKPQYLINNKQNKPGSPPWLQENHSQALEIGNSRKTPPKYDSEQAAKYRDLNQTGSISWIARGLKTSSSNTWQASKRLRCSTCPCFRQEPDAPSHSYASRRSVLGWLWFFCLSRGGDMQGLMVLGLNSRSRSSPWGYSDLEEDILFGTPLLWHQKGFRTHCHTGFRRNKALPSIPMLCHSASNLGVWWGHGYFLHPHGLRCNMASTLWLVPPLQDPDWPVSQPNLVDLVLNNKVWAPMVLGFCFDRDPLKTQWSVHLC